MLVAFPPKHRPMNHVTSVCNQTWTSAWTVALIGPLVDSGPMLSFLICGGFAWASLTIHQNHDQNQHNSIQTKNAWITVFRIRGIYRGYHIRLHYSVIGWHTLECNTWSRVEPHWTATLYILLQSNVVILRIKCCTLMCTNQWPSDTVYCRTPYKMKTNLSKKLMAKPNPITIENAKISVFSRLILSKAFGVFNWIAKITIK